MIINVKRKHIKQGVRWASTKCPIALTLKEVIPEYDYKVRINYIEVSLQKEELAHARVSQKVTKFIRAYDNGRAVNPISFKL